MIKILFVCHGNICRSPMAEFMMKDIVAKAGMADKFEIASAATSTETVYNGVGSPVYPDTKAILLEHGISCEGKRSRQITPQDFSYYDYVVAMDERNLRNMRVPKNATAKVFKLLDLTSHPRDIADPWYSGDFQATWNDLEYGLPILLDSIAKEYNLK